MQTNRRKKSFLFNAIDEWESAKFITPEQAEHMKASIQLRKFDWKQVTLYAFIISISCAALSVIVLLADEQLRMLIMKLMQLSDLGVSILLTGISILFFYISNWRFKKYVQMQMTNNAFLLLAAFLSTTAIAYWTKTLHVFQNDYSFVFLVSTVLYVVTAIYFTSIACWILALTSLSFFYGILMHNYVIYELRISLSMTFVLLGLIILGATSILKKYVSFKPFVKTHYIISLLMVFVSLWLVTIFGEYNDIDKWLTVKQYQFLLWSGLLFVATILAMYLGAKRNDFILANIGLVFFIINLISRYFEYLWEPLNKSIFFMVLALIFWLVGSKAEKLWNLKFLDTTPKNK